jgi:hypothetical protein
VWSYTAVSIVSFLQICNVTISSFVALHLLRHLMLNLNVLLVSSRVIFPEAIWTNQTFSLSLLQVTDDKNRRLAVLSLCRIFFCTGTTGGVSCVEPPSGPAPTRGSFMVPVSYSGDRVALCSVHHCYGTCILHKNTGMTVLIASTSICWLVGPCMGFGSGLVKDQLDTLVPRILLYHYH